MFKPEDLENFMLMIIERNKWVRIPYIAKLMRVKNSTVSKWIKRKIISPVAEYASAMYFDKNEIEKFAAEYIFTAEAARILQLDSEVVQRWVRRGRLKAVCGPGEFYLFRRSDVEKLMPENFLTAPQMAERLGISHSQIFRWMEKGKVKPISGPGIDDFREFLFAIPSQEELEKFKPPKDAIDSAEKAIKLGVSRETLLRYVRQGRIRPISGPGIDDSVKFWFSAHE